MADAAPAAPVTPAPQSGAQPVDPNAAPAPQGVASRGAEVITGDTGKVPAEKASPKPVDDFKPMRVKAGGKEHEIISREQLERILQRGLPVQQSLEELAAERARIEPVAAALKALSEGDEDSALEVLSQLLGDEKLMKVSERRLMREVEREKKMSGYTERERQMAAQLEQAQAQRAQWERQQAEAKAQAERQRAEEGMRQASAHIAESVSGALESLGLPKELGPQSMAAIRPLVQASIAAGAPLDPTQLAEEVREYHQSAVQWAAGKLQGEALLNFFGPEVAKNYKAALLAKLRGAPAPATAPTNAAKPAQGEQPGRWDPRRRDWVGS